MTEVKEGDAINGYCPECVDKFSTVKVNGVDTKIAPNQKVVQSLVGGKDVVIDKDTPICCDPSSNTYWEM